MKNKLLLTIILTLCSSSAMASKYWHSLGSDWKIFFDNGQTYVSSPAMASHCNYDRAQLNSYSYANPDYNKNMYAYVLSGSVTGKSLRIVLDNAQSTCQFYGANLD